jgi:hypothetical protein
MIEQNLIVEILVFITLPKIEASRLALKAKLNNCAIF